MRAQEQQARHRRSPNDRDSERLLHLSAGADPEGERQKGEDHPERRHEDRPRTDAARAHERIVENHALRLELLDTVHDEDGVLCDDADYHDDADDS